MTEKNKKKNILRRPFATGFFVLLILTSFLFTQNAKAVVGNYLKLPNDTLGSDEWNNLVNDFLARSGGRMDGNFSINTATSSFAFDVNGTAQFSQPVIVGTPTLNTHAATKSYVDSAVTGGSGSTVGYWAMSGANINNSNAGNVGVGLTNPGSKLTVKGTGNTSATAALNVTSLDDTSHLFVRDDGNVGIGTTAPGASLDVPGQVRIGKSGSGGGITLARAFDGSYQGYVGYMGATNDFVISNAGGGSTLQFRTGANTERMRIDSGGNVGIGITNPVNLLSASSSVATTIGTASTYAFYLNQLTPVAIGGDANYGYLQTFNAKPLSINPAGNDVIFNGSGNIGIGTTTTSFKLDVVGNGRFINPLIVGTPTGATHAATKSYVDSIVGGGIGTGTAGQTLRHDGTAWAANSLLFNTGTNIGIGTTTPAFKLDVNGIVNATALYVNGVPYIGSQWITNGTSVYYNTGNVGIGSTTPNYKLDVNGTASFNQPVVVGTPTLNSHATTKSYVDSIVAGGSGSTVGYWVMNGINVNNSNSGNIGIGTTTPNYKLDVNGIINATGLYVNGSAYIGSQWITNGTSVYYNTGNVGIGSTTPNYKLDVNGTGSFNQPVVVGTPTLNSHATTKSYVDGLVGGGIGTGTSGQTLRHNGTSWVANSLLFNSGVNVGIGSTTPTYKLEVNGTALFNQPVAVGTPTGATHATTKSYVDSLIAGGTGSTVGYWTMNGANINSSNAGNVGVGTTNPGVKFDVVGGSIRTDNQLISTVTGATAPLSVISTTTVDNLSASSLGMFWTGSDIAPTSYNYSKVTPVILANNSLGGIYGTGDGTAINVNSYSSSYYSWQLIGNASPWGQHEWYLREGSTSWGSLYKIWHSGNLTNNLATSSVVKWNGSSLANSIMTDNGVNVGISSSTPTYKLEVNGTALFNQPVAVGTPTGATHATTKSYVDSLIGSSIATGTPGQTLRHNGTSWIANSLLYNNGANIGIGTTSPAFKLDVNGVVNATALYVNGVPYIGSQWITNGTGIYYNTGNVGIGTTNPSAQLSVNGTANVTALDVLGTTWSSDFYSLRGQRSDGTAKSAVKGDAYGNILFQSGEGALNDFSAMNTTLFVERASSGGKVGIGTTTPAFRLEAVGGSYRFDNTVVVGTPTGPTHATTKSYVDGLVGGGVGTGTSGQTLRHNGTSWVANSLLFNDGTNIGIGITSPLSKLHIFEGTTGGNSLLLLRDNVNYSSVEIKAPSSDTPLIKSGVDDSLNFASNNSDVPSLTVSSGGNIGIATTNPNYKLDVNGTGSFNQPVAVGTPTGPTHATTKSYVDSLIGGGSGSTVGYWTMNGSNISNSNAGNVGIGTTAPEGKLEIASASNWLYLTDTTAAAAGVGGKLRFKGLQSSGGSPANFAEIRGIKDNGGEANAQGDLIFMTNNDAAGESWQPAERMRISPSGNVGIGTTDPQSKLNISEGNVLISSSLSNPNLTINAASASFPYAEFLLSNSDNTWKFSGRPGGVFAFTDASTNNQVFAINKGAAGSSFIVYDNAVSFYTGGTGNVGVGMWNPGSRLHVMGTTNNSTASALNIANSSNSSLLYVRNDGNVGIGSTTPTYKLEVNGTGFFNQPVVVGTPTGPTHAATKSYVDGLIGGSGGWTTNGNNISNSNTGFVGIGTTNPGTLLTIANDKWISAVNGAGNGYANMFKINASNQIEVGSPLLIGPLEFAQDSGMITFVDMPVSNSASIGSTEGYSMKVDGTNILSVFAQSNGAGGIQNPRVGIGTINPGYSLDVQGGSVNASTGFCINGDCKTAWSQVGGAYWNINGNSLYASSTAWNLGIGTTTPAFKLDIAGTGSFTQPVVVGTPTGNTHATTKSYVDGLIGNVSATTLSWEDNRTISPSELGINKMRFGFTSYDNNNSAPFADFLHFRSYTDATGGNDNLLVINKSGLGLRLYQQTFGTTTPYTNYKDIVLADNSPSLNYVPKYSVIGDYVSMANSTIFDNGTGVGIGTTTPVSKLQVVGTVTATGFSGPLAGTINAINVSAGEFAASTGGGNFIFGATVSGNVGIGFTNPTNKLQVGSNPAAWTNNDAVISSANGGIALHNNVGNSYVYSNQRLDLLSSGVGISVATSGNVGIATTTPTEAKLVINAGVGMALKAYGNGVFTGTMQTQTGSDFAEEFATTEDLEAGTVVVMDDHGYKSVKPSTRSHDNTVVGIVSNNPSIIAGHIISEHKAIIAMMGVVKVKVTSANGRIYKGDMLTTSNIEGYAMKADALKFGSIIGKALENLNAKTGEINVLVNLQ